MSIVKRRKLFATKKESLFHTQKIEVVLSKLKFILFYYAVQIKAQTQTK